MMKNISIEGNLGSYEHALVELVAYFYPPIPGEVEGDIADDVDVLSVQAWDSEGYDISLTSDEYSKLAAEAIFKFFDEDPWARLDRYDYAKLAREE